MQIFSTWFLDLKSRHFIMTEVGTTKEQLFLNAAWSVLDTAIVQLDF